MLRHYTFPRKGDDLPNLGSSWNLFKYWQFNLTGWFPGVGISNQFKYSCLENSVDRGVWQATVHGVTGDRHDWATKHTHVCAHTRTHTHSFYWLDSCLFSVLQDSMKFLEIFPDWGLAGFLPCVTQMSAGTPLHKIWVTLA